jgi:hypothetical protein
MYKATKTYQDDYYTHVNIASTIDMGRGLNLSGYENMVKIERGKRKRVKCLLPAASSIQKAMKCAEEIMTETVPWELVPGSNGNINYGFSFYIEKLFIHLIKSYGLEEKAKNGEVEITITIDGAKLDSKVAHVSFGFKLTNKDYVCPIAEQNMFYELKNLQSDKWCYPVKTIFEKDNQETYEEHFDNEFYFVRRVHALGIPTLGWKPFKIGEPQDMKAHQITVYRGGAAKRKTRFFHCCSKRSLEIEAENVIPCDICHEKGVSCLHASVIDDKYACKYEKDWIMEKYSLLVKTADSTFEEPDNQQVGEVVPTPDGCACMLRALPLELFPRRNAERSDSSQCSSGQYINQYKNYIGKCMVLLGIEEMVIWATRKRAVLDMLEKIEEYAHETEAGNGEGSEPVNNQLRQLVLSKMGNMLD